MESDLFDDSGAESDQVGSGREDCDEIGERDTSKDWSVLASGKTLIRRGSSEEIVLVTIGFLRVELSTRIRP